MAGKRVSRVREAIKRELGVILDRKMDDPRLGMVTVISVDLSEDLRYAKVYVSFLGGVEEKERGMRLLRRARRHVRAELASCMNLRVAPELTFVLDVSSENYLKISRVLERIREEHAEREQEHPPEDRRDS